MPVGGGSIRGSLVALFVLVVGGHASSQVVFTDITRAAGISFTNRYGPVFWPGVGTTPWYYQRNMGNGAAVGDPDNDGDFDILLLNNLGHPNVYYRNELGSSDALRFVDATAEVGLAADGLARVAQFVDLDNDGWQDLIVVNDTDPGSGSPAPASQVYRNAGDRFYLVPDTGFDPAGHITGGMGLVDYDQDGLVDVYTTAWVLWSGSAGVFPGHNRMYRNLGGFRFQDVTDQIGLGLEDNCFTPVFADFDGDGDPDLYVAVDTRFDRYYRNDGGTFVDTTFSVGAFHLGNDMGIAPKDFDRDGDLDLYVTNITDPGFFFGAGRGNTLLVNQLAETGRMTFVDQAASRGVFDTLWGWGTEWIDVDNDGDDDLYAVNGFDEWIPTVSSATVAAGLTNQPAHLFSNDGTGNFTPTSGTGADVAGDGRGVVAFDADRDGDRDLLLVHTNGPAVLLRNDTAPSGNWLCVRALGHLGGPGGVNRNAIGARIVVSAGGRTYYHHVIGGGSYLAGRPYEAHFGLGNATWVNSVRVEWPDGRVTGRRGLKANRRVLMRWAVRDR